MFSDIKHIAFGLEGDPSADQAEKVARTVELIDLLHSCGRTSDKISFPDQIRKRGELNDLLKSLNATGLRIFIGCQTRRHSAFGELIVTLKDYDDDTAEIPPGNVVGLEIETHGVVMASLSKQRTITYVAFAGESQAHQTAIIRKTIAAGGWVYDWPYELGLLRRELEAEFGRELRSWKRRDVPHWWERD